MTTCRFCSSPLTLTLVDLGTTPLANSNLRSRDEIVSEKSFPLHVMVCDECRLAQTTETIPADAIHKGLAVDVVERLKQVGRALALPLFVLGEAVIQRTPYLEVRCIDTG